jgi:hypothetical protein
MDKHELLERLRLQDVLTIIELLGITSDELVDAFLDKVDDQYEKINQALE